MLFTVSLKPGFGIGTTVCNDASIVFDFNPPIVTNEFCSTIGSAEDCENCIDDDGDGQIDRADPDCAAPANGGGAGVGDAAAGKAVDKCAKAIRKVGAKFTSTRVKQLGACEKAVADCVQLKPGDAACLVKAKATCAKVRTALPAAEAKLTSAIAKACGEPPVPAAHLLAAAGLGFDGEVGMCVGAESPGSSPLPMSPNASSGNTMCGRALVRRGSPAGSRATHPRRSRSRERRELPRDRRQRRRHGDRGRETESDSQMRRYDPEGRGQAVAGRAKAGQACGAAVFTCLRRSPAIRVCHQGWRHVHQGRRGNSETRGRLHDDHRESLRGSPLVAGDLLTSEGLGASALGARCAKLGIANLTTVADVTACLEKQLTCHVDHLLESTTPRLGELLDLGGVTLPDAAAEGGSIASAGKWLLVGSTNARHDPETALDAGGPMSAKPFLGILLAILASAALPPRPVDAAAITVTTTVDELNTDGDCSLREAVRAANTNAAVDACAAGQNDQTDTITVPAGTYTLTVAGNDEVAAGGDLDLRDNVAVDDLVINGAGAATTIIQACAVEQLSADCPAGQGIVDRVLQVGMPTSRSAASPFGMARAPVNNGARYGSGICADCQRTGCADAHRRRRHEERRRPAGNLADGGGIANGTARSRSPGDRQRQPASGRVAASRAVSGGDSTLVMTDEVP